MLNMGSCWPLLVLFVYTTFASILLVSVSDWNISHRLNNAERLRLNVTLDAAGHTPGLIPPPPPTRSPRVLIAEGDAYAQVDVHPKETKSSLRGNDVDVQLTCHADNSGGRRVGSSTSARIQRASGVSQAYIDAARGQLVCEAAVGPRDVNERAQWLLYAYE